MGIECIAYSNPDVAISEKFDDARRFARSPSRGSRWWFMYHGIPGIPHENKSDSIDIGIYDFDGADHLVARMYGFSFLVPMISDVVFGNIDDFPEPEYRYHEVIA
jgi:hypothetical protein